MIINAAKAAEAARILRVELTTLTPDLLSAAYRTEAKEYHPDSADKYDPQKWADVSWAKEVLVRWLEQKQPAPAAQQPEQPKGDCRSCGGSGRIVVARPRGFGSKPTTMMCVMCNGSGTMPTGGAPGYAGD